MRMTPLSPSDRISPSVEALVSAIPAGADCLSESEAATLREIYSGAEDTDGKSIFPGYPPGASPARRHGFYGLPAVIRSGRRERL